MGNKKLSSVSRIDNKNFKVLGEYISLLYLRLLTVWRLHVHVFLLCNTILLLISKYGTKLISYFIYSEITDTYLTCYC